MNEWKSPDIDEFKTNKVLVIGITPDPVTRRTFEQKLTSNLDKNGVIAVKSIDFFEKSFNEVKRTESQLNQIEDQLMEAGFDAVMFTTVTDSENKVTVTQSLKDLNNTIGSFRDYYYSNQHVYYEEYGKDVYQIYHTETSLYCICPGEERNLIWKGFIDIIDPQKMERSVSEYVKVLIKGLEEQQLLMVN